MEIFKLADETFVAIDFEHGEIADITQKGRRVNDGRAPIFSVKLRKRTGVTLWHDCGRGADGG